MTITLGELEASIQEKIEADTDFQSELENLDDDERETKISERKTELFDKELADMNKAKELAYNYKVRAEKAEKQLKIAPKKEDKTSKNDNYSLQDIKALSDVHDDDVSEIVEYAKFKGISIADAKKSNVIIVSLKEKQEIRQSAIASATGKASRGGNTNSGEALLTHLESTKELPESKEDMDRLAQARFERMKNANKH